MLAALPRARALALARLAAVGGWRGRGRGRGRGRAAVTWAAGRGTRRPGPGLGLGLLAAFSMFSSHAAEAGEARADTDDAIITLLKKAKLSIVTGELEEAERLLHQAARLAQRSQHRQGIVYAYTMMANLALLRGQLDSVSEALRGASPVSCPPMPGCSSVTPSCSATARRRAGLWSQGHWRGGSFGPRAEKLFKAAISFLLAGDTKPDDNAIIEMSLKLASIYAAQNQDQQALAGYKFCILTLEEKIAAQKDLPENILPAGERANTHLLLGLSLDSYGRYLVARNQPTVAQIMYERALQISKDIQGETHPQTVVLMSDLATVLDAQGRYNEAYTYAKRAAELAKQTKHPEEHVVLNNLAGILMHKEDFLQAKHVYEAALKQAQQKGDDASVQHIQKELAKLATWRKAQTP